MTSAGFVLGEVSRVYSDEPEGLVFAYPGADGSKVAEGSSVDLQVSAGRTPSIEGLSESDATALITAAGIKIKGVVTEYSDTVAAGRVIKMTALSPPLSVGGRVNLIVSKGPRTVVMPNVVGETILAAKALLESLGLKVAIDTNQLEKNWGIAKVKSASALAGQVIRIGDTVTITSR